MVRKQRKRVAQIPPLEKDQWLATEEEHEEQVRRVKVGAMREKEEDEEGAH